MEYEKRDKRKTEEEEEEEKEETCSPPTKTIKVGRRINYITGA